MAWQAGCRIDTHVVDGRTDRSEVAEHVAKVVDGKGARTQTDLEFQWRVMCVHETTFNIPLNGEAVM